MKDLEFDGWWEGEEVFTCDCCGRREKFHFDSEDIDTRGHRKLLKAKGWIFTQVDGRWKDFCSERCRNKYIRDNTI